MARQKRTSAVLEAAHKRLAGLSSITPPADFGVSLSVAAYSTAISDFTVTLNHYNQMVAAADEAQNQVEAAEKTLNELSNRMLAAAKAHYGPDSNEYEQAGGKRTRDRKRHTRRAVAKSA